MKIPQRLEPYQRSRHRATLHAWVMAATAVASIGMPAAALASMSRDDSPTVTCRDGQTPAQAAKRAAGDWLNALRRADLGSAIASMRLPQLPEHERDALDEVTALSDWMQASGTAFEPVAERRAGHWALSAWCLDGPDALAEGSGLIEPVMLYNPVADDLVDTSMQWEVVPQGFDDDPALAPLYNADHDALVDWYDTLG